jgi:lipoate-protein ligase A
MALDKIILEEVAQRGSPPTIRFLQFSPAAALVGYHQDADQEIRKDYCRTHGIDINRRLTGGGSILFQETALGWEVFSVPGEGPFQGGYETLLTRICGAAAAAVSQLGIPARFRPRNDIEIQGRKISGTGGTTISGGFMFQGTLLIENEVERFLKSLRVPVEKLKKREIESLMDRMCFLSDLVPHVPPIERIKEIIATELASRLGVQLVKGGLSRTEERRLQEELPFFESDAWIHARRRRAYEGEPVRSITQTEAGTLRVHLWLSPGGRRVRQALIVGDFFAIPPRLIHDLEAALVGLPAEKAALKSAVSAFLASYDGEILGIQASLIGDAVAHAAERLLLTRRSFSRNEINDLFLLNLSPEDFHRRSPKWLLLPYCSKDPQCEYRQIPGCSECGGCEIGECFALARSFDMDPITIQSFEHLLVVLREKCCDPDGMYVGSCCEAFYAKHQREMKRVSAQGVLVNLDSTTCYDLGKGSDAYRGKFDTKTSLNFPLIEKTIRLLHAGHSSL